MIGAITVTWKGSPTVVGNGIFKENDIDVTIGFSETLLGPCKHTVCISFNGNGM